MSHLNSSEDKGCTLTFPSYGVSVVNATRHSVICLEEARQQQAKGLRRSGYIAIIPSNTPAKPMWTSVLTLKSRGFFIACFSGCALNGSMEAPA